MNLVTCQTVSNSFMRTNKIKTKVPFKKQAQNNRKRKKLKSREDKIKEKELKRMKCKNF